MIGARIATQARSVLILPAASLRPRPTATVAQFENKESRSLTLVGGEGSGNDLALVKGLAGEMAWFWAGWGGMGSSVIF